MNPCFTEAPRVSLGSVRRPHFFIRVFCTATAVLAAAVAVAAPAEYYLRVESFSHAEPVSVYSYVTGWKGPLRSGSDAVTHNWIESGACYDRVCLGLLHRLDYEVKASRDTAALYHSVRNRQTLNPGQTYDLDLQIWHQSSRGLRLSYRNEPRAGLSLEYGISFLDAQRLTDGRLAGRATASGPGDYDYDVEVGYFYSEDALFERSAALPKGKGLSIDLSADWHINDRLSVHAQVRDLYGYLKWDRAPFTTATATSDTKSFGADGYVNYNPTISGVEGSGDYQQRLHPRALLRVDWQGSRNNTIGLGLRLTEVKTYASLHAERQYPGCMALNIEIMPIQRALGLGVSCGFASFSLMSDTFRLRDAHLLQMNAALAYRF